MKMNAEKKIKKYIGRRWADVVGFVLLAIAVISAVLGCLLDAHIIGKSLDQPVEMTNETKSGYVYLDIYAISEQIYYWHEESAKDYYYLANDEEGNFYFVMFNEPMEGVLKQQRAYWDDYTDAKKPEEPYYVCGTVRNVADEAFLALEEKTGYESEKLKKIISNKGKKGIDVDLKMSRHIASDFEVFAICLGTFAVCWICCGSHRRKLARMTVKRLNELGMTEKAAQELEAAGKTKTPLLLTKSFIFGHHAGAVFAYDDIALLFTTDASAFIYTKTIAGFRILNNPNMRGVLYELVAEISKRAPYAMVGATTENMMQYERLYPEAKKL